TGATCEMHPLLPEESEKFSRRHAGSIDVEEHDVRLDATRIHSYSWNLGQSFRETARVRVILCQAVHIVLECDQSRCSDHAYLSHVTAQHLAPATRPQDEVGGAGEHRANGRSQPLGEAEGHRV